MSAREAVAKKLIAEAREFLSKDKINQARGSLRKSFDLSPSYDAVFLTALTYVRQGNVKLANNYFQRAVEVDPANAEGFYNLAYSHQLLKDFAAAAASYENALQLRPDYHQALHNLGVAYRELGIFDKSRASLESAIKLKPDSVESYYNLGCVLLALQRNEEALEALNIAIKSAPNHVKALHNRGMANLALHRSHDAIADFTAAIALDPEDIELWLSKAKAASSSYQVNLAIEAYQGVLRLDENHQDALLDLAFNLEKLGRYAESARIFERLTKMGAKIDFLAGFLHSARVHVCDWAGFQDSAKKILQRVEKSEPAMVPHSVILLPSQRMHQKRAAEIWASRVALTHPIDVEKRYRVRRDGKIRLGYFSPDLHGHPVGMLLAPVFELHDRSKFEVYAFSMGSPTRDETRLRIEVGVDHFINIREMSDDEVVDLAFKESIDIAIDLSGYTAGHRVHLFSKGLAPVQVSYLGYSGTLGAEFVDYIIGDQTVIPFAHDCDYSEKVIRLPHCYMPGDPDREISTETITRAQYGLPEQGFVFCGFNNVYKICPPQFDLWMEILRNVQDSVLWLSSASGEVKANLKKEAAARGIDPERLIFANREERISVHLARHQFADLFLDTLPHNAHATSNDALFAGLPILTRLGEGFAARVAGSLVASVGMSDMIMPDDRSYVRRAIEIANTPGLSEELKARLAFNKKTSSLFDIKTYTLGLERAFAHIHERHLAGEKPESFDVLL